MCPIELIIAAYIMDLMIINASGLDVKKSLLEIYSCYACINTGIWLIHFTPTIYYDQLALTVDPGKAQVFS